MKRYTMKRREVIQSMGLISTHVLFPSILLGFISGCKNPSKAKEIYSPVFFSQEEFEIIREVIDVILPATKTKSASQVNTHHFLDEVFDKCMTQEQQELIREGLSRLIPRFSSTGNKRDLLAEIDRKAYDNDEYSAYFKIIKQYTLVGFFTSLEGMTKASNYVEFPGDYQGEILCDEDTLNYGKANLRYYL